MRVRIKSQMKFTKGTLYCFYYQEKLIVHRFLRYTDSRLLVMKGDNRLRNEVVETSQIIGEVTELIYKNGGHLELTYGIGRKINMILFFLVKSDFFSIFFTPMRWILCSILFIFAR